MTDNRERIRIAHRKDFKISFYIGSGKGGQNKQKNHTGVLIQHIESGAEGRCSETRSQEQNKKKAFLNLTKTPKFKIWLNKKLFEIQEKQTLEEFIENWTSPEHLKIEIYKNGKWIEVKEKDLIND